MHGNKVCLIKFSKRLFLELAFVLSLSVPCRLSPCLSCPAAGAPSGVAMSLCHITLLTGIMAKTHPQFQQLLPSWLFWWWHKSSGVPSNEFSGISSLIVVGKSVSIKINSSLVKLSGCHLLRIHLELFWASYWNNMVMFACLRVYVHIREGMWGAMQLSSRNIMIQKSDFAPKVCFSRFTATSVEFSCIWN